MTDGIATEINHLLEARQSATADSVCRDALGEANTIAAISAQDSVPGPEPRLQRSIRLASIQHGRCRVIEHRRPGHAATGSAAAPRYRVGHGAAPSDPVRGPDPPRHDIRDRAGPHRHGTRRNHRCPNHCDRITRYPGFARRAAGRGLAAAAVGPSPRRRSRGHDPTHFGAMAAPQPPYRVAAAALVLAVVVAVVTTTLHGLPKPTPITPSAYGAQTVLPFPQPQPNVVGVAVDGGGECTSACSSPAATSRVIRPKGRRGS